MSKDPTDMGTAFRNNHRIKQGHQFSDIDLSPKPEKSTLVAENYSPKMVKVKTHI